MRRAASSEYNRIVEMLAQLSSVLCREQCMMGSIARLREHQLASYLSNCGDSYHFIILVIIAIAVNLLRPITLAPDSVAWKYILILYLRKSIQLGRALNNWRKGMQ